MRVSGRGEGGEGKVMGGGKKREREEGREGAKAAHSGGGYPLSWSSPQRDGRHTEWWRGGISRRPHDLFRPGGTYASQPLMAITLPNPLVLESRKEKTRVRQARK